MIDAACGSGGFLVKSMSNMIKEFGGIQTDKAKKIKSQQLFGIEFDREIFALACANMLIHKDGKTNLEQLDSRTLKAGEWIREKKITKVLMNSPFERKYGCLKIVENVLDNVPQHTMCAFILPDKKLEKDNSASILKHHQLQKIVKLPEKVFSEGVTTSVFIFESGILQNNKEIFTCYIEDDGLETVKNQGRHDIKDRWQEIEDKFVDIIHKQSGDDTIQWIKPEEHVYESLKGLNSESNNFKKVNIIKWKEFVLEDLFDFVNSTAYHQKNVKDADGLSESIAYVTRSKLNNGLNKYVIKEPYFNVNPANTISFGAENANFFYQPEPYITGNKMYYIDTSTIPKYACLYIKTILEATFSSKYSFSDGMIPNRIKRKIIKLPIDKSGNPDFEFMDKCMRQLMEKEKNKFKYLQLL